MLTFEQIIDKIDQQEDAAALLAAIQVKIFSALKKDRLTPKAVAKKAGTHPESTDALLHALAAMGALKKVRDRFQNTPETYKHLCDASPHYKKGIVWLRSHHQREWSALLDLLQSGRDVSQYAGGDDPEFRRPFTHAMHERSEPYRDEVAEAIAHKPVGRLIDLGGGPGSYSEAILRRDKQATAVVLDRPATIAVAREIHKDSKAKKRLGFMEGDLFDTDYGEGFNTVLFSNILHIYDPKQNKKLFRKIHRCLAPKGRLIVVDIFLKESRTAPHDAALFSLTMLLYTATGKTYTIKETEALLRDSGFGSFKRSVVEERASIIECVKK